MTLTGIKITRKELEKIKEWLPPTPDPVDLEAEAFIASLSLAEVTKISEILMRFDDDQEIDLDQLTPEEAEFLVKINERPVPPMQPIDHTKPRCIACGKQPVNEEGFCAECFAAVGGMADVSKLSRDKNGNFLA